MTEPSPLHGQRKPQRPRRSAPVHLVGPEDPEADQRPLLRLGPALHENVQVALQALAADPELYQRDRALVRVTLAVEGGAPVITPHTLATLRVRLARFARVQRWDKLAEAWLDALPTDHVVRGVLEQAEWPPEIRRLTGLLEAPAMRPDGSVLEERGYDAPTGYLHLPEREYPTVPEAPTQDEAAERLRWAWTGLCHDFPYRGLGYPAEASGADADGVLRFVAAQGCPDAWGLVAAALTLLARPALGRTSLPAIVFDASTPGSGKGKQLDILGLLCFGRVPAKLTWPTGTDGDQELEKQFGGEALGGAQLVVLDEITGPFGGPTVNKVLTGGGWAKIRILGKSSTPTLAWDALIVGAGNNISFRDNTHRRILVPRLEPPVQDPERHKGWRHPNLERWVLEHRGELVTSLLTVLRGYVCAGRPDMGLEVWGGFERWSELVPRAIKWAGGGDVMGCRPSHDPEARNEEQAAVEVVLEAIARLAPADRSGITASTMLGVLYSAERIRGKLADGSPLPPDGYDDAREAIDGLTRTRGGRRPESRALGEVLRRWRRRPTGAGVLERAGEDRTGVTRWRVVSRVASHQNATVGHECHTT